MEDGRDNIRYLLLSMDEPTYTGLVQRFKNIHTQKEAGNTLTVLPNIAGTQSIVKVCGHVGWLDDEAGTMADGRASGAIAEIYTYDDLPTVQGLLGSADWPQIA